MQWKKKAMRQFTLFLWFSSGRQRLGAASSCLCVSNGNPQQTLAVRRPSELQGHEENRGELQLAPSKNTTQARRVGATGSVGKVGEEMKYRSREPEVFVNTLEVTKKKILSQSVFSPTQCVDSSVLMADKHPSQFHIHVCFWVAAEPRRRVNISWGRCTRQVSASATHL